MMEGSLDETLRSGSKSKRRTRRVSEPTQPSPRRSTKSPSRSQTSSIECTEYAQPSGVCSTKTSSDETEPTQQIARRSTKTPTRTKSSPLVDEDPTQVSSRRPTRKSTSSYVDTEHTQPSPRRSARTSQSSVDSEHTQPSPRRSARTSQSSVDSEPTQPSPRRSARTSQSSVDSEHTQPSPRRSARTSQSSVDSEPTQPSPRRSARTSQSSVDNEPTQPSPRRFRTSTSSSFGTLDSPRLQHSNDSVNSSQSDLCEHTCNTCNANKTDSMCVDCQISMCSQCMEDHLTEHGTHRATDVSIKSEILTIPSATGCSFGVCTCSDITKSTDVYCSDEGVFCCKQCETSNHKSCNTRSVESLLIETDISKLKASTSKHLKERLGDFLHYMGGNRKDKIDEYKDILAKKSKRHMTKLIHTIKEAHERFLNELDKALAANLEMVQLCERNIRGIQLDIQGIEQPKRLSQCEDRLTQLKLLKTIECKNLNNYENVAKKLKETTGVAKLNYHPNDEILDHLKQISIGQLCKRGELTNTSSCSLSAISTASCNGNDTNSKHMCDDSNKNTPMSEENTIMLAGDTVCDDRISQDNTNRSPNNTDVHISENSIHQCSGRTENELNLSDNSINQSLGDTCGVDIVHVLYDKDASRENTNKLSESNRVQVSETDCDFIPCWTEGDCGTKTCITDIKRVNDNTLIVADYDNKKLKVLRRHGTSAGCIISEELEGEPWQIAEYDTDKFVVTVLQDSKPMCMFIEVLGLFISVKTSFQLHRECTGIAVNGNDVITCGYDGEHAYIIVTDILGNFQNEINFHTKTGLQRPNYLCVSDDASLLYVSDADRGVFGLSTSDLNVVVFRFKQDIVCPMGMTLDNNGDLIVCAAQSHALYRLSKDGQLKAVYTVKHKQFQFQSVCLFEDAYVIASSDNTGYKLIKIPISD